MAPTCGFGILTVSRPPGADLVRNPFAFALFTDHPVTSAFEGKAALVSSRSASRYDSPSRSDAGGPKNHRDDIAGATRVELSPWGSLAAEGVPLSRWDRL